MIVEFDKSFSKTLSKVKDKSSLRKTEKLILEIEKTEELSSITNLNPENSYEFSAKG